MNISGCLPDMWRHAGATSRCPVKVSYSLTLKPRGKKNKLEITTTALANARFVLFFNVMGSSDPDADLLAIATNLQDSTKSDDLLD